MDISFTGLKLPAKGALVLLVEKGAKLAGMAKDADSAAGGAFKRAMDVSRFTGAKGQTVEIVAPSGIEADRVLLLGIGEVSELDSVGWTELGATIYAKLAGAGSESLTLVSEDSAAAALDMAEGIKLRSWRFDRYRTKEPARKKPTLVSATLAVAEPDAATAAFTARSEVAEGVFLTRELVSEPGNILYPASFADRISELNVHGVDVEILGEAEMEKLDMKALLGVGQGSAHESKMAIMRWNGAGDDSQPIAFVGKGVTFDSGGISLKPGEGMDQMKWDMGGAGTVVGLMRALAGRKAKVNVVAIVGLVENMPGSKAQRPGDVVTSMSGQTIEILNTDAEGRLVLADALWYCQQQYKPKFMIDLATLTGAMIVSLGHEHAGFFTDSDEIADGLAGAGKATGDKVWRLPLHDNYDKMINCVTADMKNIGGRGAGSITAAQFLKRFTNKVPWAHIDIAGTVWSDKDLPLSEKGGTGHGVRLLDRFVADNYEK